MQKSLNYLEILEERKKNLLKETVDIVKLINDYQKLLKEKEIELLENVKEAEQFEAYLKSFEQ